MEIFKHYKTTKAGIKYEVSNYGNVKRNGIIQDIYLNQYGYARAKGVLLIHRAVAELFIECPNDGNKYEVNHKDGNRSNNVYTNLEWCTHKENCNKEHTRKKNSESQKDRWTSLRQTGYNRKHYRYVDVVIDGVTYKTTDDAMNQLGRSRKWVIAHATSYKRGSL